MIAAALLLVGAIYLGSAVLIPILLAYFVFVLLDPLAAWAERRRISRSVSAPVLVLVFMGAAGVMGWGGYETFALLGQQVPQYQRKVQLLVHSIEKKAQSLERGAGTFLSARNREGEEPGASGVVERPSGEAWREFLLKGLNSVFAAVAMFLLIHVLALFLLLERAHLGRRLVEGIGPPVLLERFARENTRMVRAFFLGNLAVGALMSGCFFILFSLLGLDNEVALAVFSGFINLIPIVGSVLGAVLPAVQAILQFDTAGPVLGILGTSVFLHIVVANLVMPKLVGTRINVNLTAATVGFIFWGWCWGGVGLLLAIPLMALVRGALALRPATRPWADLIAEGPPEGSDLGGATPLNPSVPKIGRRKSTEARRADTTARL